MTWIKRIFLFGLTNIAVIVLLTIVLRILGLDQAMAARGNDPMVLLAFAAVMGMGGSFISLAMSKWMAKRFMGVRVIEQPRSALERWLVETVARMARESGIGMPEVGIFDSPDPNAFATGMSRNDALVAVSTGLLQRMRQEEVEAVLGHEVAHVANGDMVTLGLLQGVLNTFVIFLSRMIGMVVDNALSRGEQRQGYGIGYFATVIVAEIVLGLFATMIVMAFSRWREFRADAGGAALTNRAAMIAALERLREAHEPPLMPDQLRAFGIRSGGGMMRLFMSHPPLEERIAALRAAG
ncbi:MAG TPA: protease HtpX [Candidatus Acidoferrales bacterium]|nr:protease HtpX [Candidatus Acidoferrales bacterium]